jgi:hypothetical protein
MIDASPENSLNNEPRLPGNRLETKVPESNRDLDVALHVVPEYLAARGEDGKVPESQAVSFKRGEWDYRVRDYKDDSGILVRSINRIKTADGNRTIELYTLRMPNSQAVDPASRQPGDSMEIEVTLNNGKELHLSTQTAADKFDIMIKDILNPPDPALNFKPEEMKVPEPPEVAAPDQSSTGARRLLSKLGALLSGRPSTK